MSLTKMKRKIYLGLEKKLSDGRLKDALILLNHIVFHWSQRRHIIHPGKQNPDKTYYVIRPSGAVEGLLSMYHGAAMAAWKAQRAGSMPYIDYENTPTQYQEHELIHGTKNVWEYYFMQPSDVRLKEIKVSKNVILSGWSIHKEPATKVQDRTMWEPHFRMFCQKQCGIQPYILDIASKRKQELHINGEVLAVFLRGTDYVRLQPKGHAIQPEPDDVIKKADEFLKKYMLKRIFLVTEDQSIYDKFVAYFGDNVFTSDDNFVKEYDGSDYIANSITVSPYMRGLNYLVRIILMSECDYLVSSIASGSVFALNMKKEPYKASYIFDLGDYA